LLQAIDHAVDHGAPLGRVDGAVRLVTILRHEWRANAKRSERESPAHGECS